MVTGYSSGVTSRWDYTTIAYSRCGVPLWTNRYHGPADGQDEPGSGSSIAVGRDGAGFVLALHGDYCAVTSA